MNSGTPNRSATQGHPPDRDAWRRARRDYVVRIGGPLGYFGAVPFALDANQPPPAAGPRLADADGSSEAAYRPVRCVGPKIIEIAEIPTRRPPPRIVYGSGSICGVAQGSGGD